MSVATPELVFRSLGTAAVLALNNLSPEEDFGEFENPLSVPRFTMDGGIRVGVTYQGQDMPLIYGPFGTMLIPGITVEFGPIENRRGKCSAAVILSVGRLIRYEPEIELKYLYDLCSRLYDLVFVTKNCPIYNFDAGEDDIYYKLGSVMWLDEVFRESPPYEKLVANPVQVGGWYRNEYRFTARWTKDSGPL